MNKVSIIKAIVKLYFVGALAGSFTHLVTAAGKGGLQGWEMWSVPFMIDGIAVIGMIMRSEAFSKRTRKIGFRTQMGAGILSLAGNVYAAHNVGGMAYGIGIVALFLFAEWLSDQIQSAEIDKAAELAAKKAASVAKAQATRKRNARTRKAEVKVLENMLSK